jgi:hypothetical protein
VPQSELIGSPPFAGVQKPAYLGGFLESSVRWRSPTFTRVVVKIVVNCDRGKVSYFQFPTDSDRGAHGQTTAGGYGAIVGREDIHIERLSEEHGWLHLDPAGSDVEIGDTLEIVPVHACPVANLAHELTVVRDGTVIGRWAVAAAGRVR